MHVLIGVATVCLGGAVLFVANDTMSVFGGILLVVAGFLSMIVK